MSLLKKIRNTLALGTVLAASAYSQETIQPIVNPIIPATSQLSQIVDTRKSAPEKRNVQFNLDSQFDSMESDKNFWYSANQSWGKMIDQIATRQEKGSSEAGRAFTALLSYWISYGMNYYGHENAHTIPERNHGGKKGFEINWNRWDIIAWPEMIMDPIPSRISAKLSDEEEFQGLVAGLNYNEESSKMAWQRFWLNDEKDFHSNAYFLVSKLRDAWYTLQVGMKDRRDNPNEPEVGDIDHNDIDMYVRELHLKGINLTKPQYLLQTAVADVLSFHLWKSLESPWEYVINKNQKSNDYSFSLGNLKVAPPLISHYLTDKGSFFDLSIMINPSSRNPIELSLGFDVDFIGESELDRLRFACQYHFMNLGKIDIAPYAAWDLTKKLQSKGFSAGMSANYNLRNFGIFARAGYNIDDIIENAVDMKGNGAEFSSGVTYKF